MCFSATASFVGSAVLGTIGIATLSQVKTRRELPLALVPILFAIQQFLEGFVWLTIPDSPYLKVFSYGFLFFAFILWPTYFPFVERCLQKAKGRIEIQDFLLGMGFMLSLYLGLILFSAPLHVTVVENCINYGIEIPFVKTVIPFYLLISVGGFFLSKSRPLQWFAGAMIVSFLATIWAYANAFTSVWCFFSAALSLILLLYFRKKTR